MRCVLTFLASPSSAEELRKHLTELSAFRSLESGGGPSVGVGSVQLDWNGTMLAMGMSRCLTGTTLSAGQYWIVRNSWPESQGLRVRER